jgi:hypothetical protein
MDGIPCLLLFVFPRLPRHGAQALAKVIQIRRPRFFEL